MRFFEDPVQRPERFGHDRKRRLDPADTIDRRQSAGRLETRLMALVSAIGIGADSDARGDHQECPRVDVRRTAYRVRRGTLDRVQGCRRGTRVAQHLQNLRTEGGADHL